MLNKTRKTHDDGKKRARQSVTFLIAVAIKLKESNITIRRMGCKTRISFSIRSNFCTNAGETRLSLQ